MSAVISEAIGRWLARHNEDLIAIRRDLHAHPELSDEEYRTTDVIEQRLRDAGLEPRRLPSGTGCVVDIPPRVERDDLPILAFRGDIDGLPIQEETGLSYSSTTPGISHACGHDVHTTVALGLALALADSRPQVRVRIIFQPREELMGGGALDVIAAGEIDGVERIFSIHCDPKVMVGEVGLVTGPITSAGDTLELRVFGGGGHSSRPHLTQDVVYALSSIVTTVPGILSRRVDPRSGTVCVFGAIHAGDAANAIAEEGILRGTIRTADRDVWWSLEPMVREAISSILTPLGLVYDLTYVKGVPPVVNEQLSTELMIRSVKSIDPRALTTTSQSSGGEDFAWYTDEIPGAMARLGTWSGSGEPGELHRSTLVIDERAIAVGVRLFGGVIDEYQTLWRARRHGVVER